MVNVGQKHCPWLGLDGLKRQSFWLSYIVVRSDAVVGMYGNRMLKHTAIQSNRQN